MRSNRRDTRDAGQARSIPPPCQPSRTTEAQPDGGGSIGRRLTLGGLIGLVLGGLVLATLTAFHGGDRRDAPVESRSLPPDTLPERR